MDGFAQFYVSMTVATAIFVCAETRPRGAGELIGFVLIAALWPTAFLYALYHAVKRGAA